MNFHPEKCQVIRICTNKRFQRETTYTPHGHILEAVDSAKYLGDTISEDLQWKAHIDNITAKASRTVRFLRRNLYNYTNELREATYCTLVRPTLEYASAFWDPIRTTDTIWNKFKKELHGLCIEITGTELQDVYPTWSENLVGLLGWIDDVP